jgi:hypothetical protein
MYYLFLKIFSLYIFVFMKAACQLTTAGISVVARLSQIKKSCYLPCCKFQFSVFDVLPPFPDEDC